GALDLETTGYGSAPNGCNGSMPLAPQLVLRTTHSVALRIHPRATSGDLVLAVQTPDGRTHCDDDSGGSRDPLVSALSPPGDIRVWVGTYEQGETIDFALDISATRQELPSDETAGQLVLDGPGPNARGAWDGTVNAATEASVMSSSCRG